MKNNYFLLYAHCIPVKGKTRSVICDLQNHQLKLIPNDLHDILLAYNGKKISTIKKDYNNEFNDVIDEYFDFLIANDFIFFTENPELFPKLSVTWKDPLYINHALLDRGKESSYDIYSTLRQLDTLGCKHIQIRFFSDVEIHQLTKINELLEEMESSIISLEVILPFSENIDIDQLNNLITKYPRVTSLIVYNAPFNKKITPVKNNMNHFFFTKEKITSHLFCGVISVGYFSINIKNFTESLHHNSCLHKKIAIDTNGNIKNCPSMAQSFGNIQNTTLEEALNHPDFKKYWNITKDQVAVCKDCEFRYVCTDCRAYLENPEDQYSKPLKCGYNPYTNEWEEWSANPLKQKAMQYYGM